MTEKKSENTKEIIDAVLPELRSAVDSHLFKWFAALGIVNFSALVVGLVYIFFIVPDKAVSEATSIIQVKSQTAVADLQTQLMKITGEALIKGGQAQGLSTTALGQANDLTREVASRRKKLDDVKNEDLVKLTDAIEVLAKNPNIETALNLVPKVSNLQNELNRMRNLQFTMACNSTSGGNICDIAPANCPSGWSASDAVMVNSYSGGKCGNGSKCRLCYKVGSN